ncbi:amidophosphoribosyltransferase [Aristophania vespae]|uniref:Amidophosphoribosyltransferase n=1 Tax=Aristophania vespae TaxID=2697033 RepID=A0A6P1NEA4_9PROT|nr:amidophosphoribosyltransferase [Aristophania vespae]QHI95217.1 amidophosphoribosyltransferase [Aristophania vespae]UMM64452.1 Amidophosphoribosyltransferase [Aristophania vespae]
MTLLESSNRPHEECGVFGIWGVPEAAALTALGLHALQHRGQESAGIVSFDGKEFHQHRGLGLVGEVFADSAVIASLPGQAAIGHNRYATTGGMHLRNVQPFYADYAFGGLAVAHNGNLTNAATLRRALVGRGCIFQSTTDTEVFVHLIAISLYSSIVDRLIDAAKQVKGAYSLIALMPDNGLIGMRDPLGVRPLVLGRMPGHEENNGGWVLASETCALDIIGAQYVRDIEPGEMVIINNKGLESIRPFGDLGHRFCVFEYIYFARPDSVLEGKSVYDSRTLIGAELARESAVEADVIVPVPDSGVPSAIGYAKESNIPFELGIIRNHYIGRTFIEPTDQIRHLGVKMKHSANRAILEGKRVILVDDSIVRGTTSRKIVDMVRAAGATEVHMRITSPPTKHPCFYGIDTPDENKLLAATHTIEEMKNAIGVDSLAFISFDGLYRALDYKSRDEAQHRFCDACFSGDYPISLVDKEGKLVQ